VLFDELPQAVTSIKTRATANDRQHGTKDVAPDRFPFGNLEPQRLKVVDLVQRRISSQVQAVESPDRYAHHLVGGYSVAEEGAEHSHLGGASDRAAGQDKDRVGGSAAESPTELGNSGHWVNVAAFGRIGVWSRHGRFQ